MNDETNSFESIAVIGLAGRWPGAPNVDQFWHNVRNGVESIGKFSDEELEAHGVAPDIYNDPNYVKAGTVLEEVDTFDAGFFGFNPREAETIDPQQRIFLETAWAALENAGYDPERHAGPIGVYAGASMNSYVYNLLSAAPNIARPEGYQQMLGNEKDYLASRVSYKLNLKGPGLTVQTACSTSLVAVHLACQDLLNYQCDMALAGGVCLIFPQKRGYLYQEGMIFSPDGHCRAFDAGAKGTVPGQGAGIVVLKRLSEARAHGDMIYAVIKGSAINNDGSQKIGYTAPSVDGQAGVIASAQALSQIDPATITYVEAHGTGTPLGDPIEIAALTQAFRAGTPKKGFCAIGSVKTNIGHLDVAAGVTGLIKTVLALKHKQIPPSLHFKSPNPEIDFENSPFYVNDRLADWQVNGFPRRAGVSSFGIGGTNAHVVLEEAPQAESSDPIRSRQVLLLSAKTAKALDAMTADLAEHLKQNPNINLADAAYSLQAGRQRFNHRRALVSAGPQEALAALQEGRLLSAVAPPNTPAVVFMFSGQGSQYVNMGLDLYRSEAVFREAVDRCCELLKPRLDLDLRSILYPGKADDIDAAQEMLTRTAITQPALFTIEYALARLWMAWGLQPAAMVGHSIGEYVAACLSGVFSLEDALALVAARGRLIQKLPGGSMLAVSLPEAQVQPYFGNPLSLAAVNSPQLCVLSGKSEAIEKIEKQLARQAVGYRRLHTSHAFHSKMMEPVLTEFEERVGRVAHHAPQIPYLSNVSGTWQTAAGAADPGYWTRHMRQTVRFADSVQELLKESDRILLEVGPGNTLSTLAKQCSPDAQNHLILSSMRHPKAQTSDTGFILTSLGRMWLAGIEPDWDGFYADEKRSRMTLPTYPFERRRFWIDRSQKTDTGAARDTPQGSAAASLAKQKNDLADWFFVPSWKQTAVPDLQPNKMAARSRWLIFLDKVGLGARLAKQLEQSNQDVIRVKIGKKFSSRNNRLYTINPQRSQDYDAMFDDLQNRNRVPETIVHLWNVTGNTPEKFALSRIDKTQDLGIYSLLYIAQAIGKHDGNHPFQIEVVSSNMHDVTGQETLMPEKSTLLGASKVIPLEYANIGCRSIDVHISKKGLRNPNGLLSQLLSEFYSDLPDTLVAYRGNHRWVQSFEPVRLDETTEDKTRLRSGGVYMITGGLGGVGLALAEDIAKTDQAKLVLVGRSAFPDRKEWASWLQRHDSDDKTSQRIRKLQAIEASGAEVRVVSADIANPEQMQGVIDRVGAHFGRINGVIHAAGVIDDAGAIQGRTREMTARGLQSKVNGTLVIHEILKDVPLDFMLFCSSIASVLYHNRFGQVSYVAANSFLDTFSAGTTQKEGIFSVTINWDDWRDIGMSARAQEQFKQTFGRSGDLVDPLDQFSPAQGVQIFRRILNSNLSRVIVSTRDLARRVEQDVFISSPFLEAAAKSELAAPAHPRPDIENPYVAPSNRVEQKMADIWQEILGVEKVGVQDNFFDLGGDSLIAVRLFAGIEKIFGKNLPLATLYESPTVAQLAHLIDDTQASNAAWSSLVQIQAGGSRPPLFFVHGAGGNVLIYRDLARHLGPDQPVFGLQSQGLDGRQPFLNSIEDMASHYLEEIQAVQPEGPYILGGYCMGGTVAFEMAQQLRAQDKKVALLVMFETYVWKYLRYESWFDKAYYQVQKMGFHWRNFALLNAGEKRTFIREKLKVARGRRKVWSGMLAAKMRHSFRPGHDQDSSLFSLWENNDDAAIGYEPQVYPGRIIQFRPVQDYSRYDNPNFGWEKLASEGVEIHKMPVYPAGMLVEPFVPLLAETLKGCLREALEAKSNE